MLEFWTAALYYTEREPASDGWVVLTDPNEKGINISLQQVPEKRNGKRGRLHIDLYTENQQEEVERLVTLGATRCPWRYQPSDDFIVLADPDHNLFCVVQMPGGKSCCSSVLPPQGYKHNN
ncbi:VOC family protein [Flavobacterium sp. DGU11]|uniref:VOC family protein n=1 Tax=Flavobacterium arundinis TaxID=3139143 RepID=A0ABU9HZH0_9FLAO